MPALGEDERFQLLAAIAEVTDRAVALEAAVERVLDLVAASFADIVIVDATASTGAARRLGVRAAVEPRAAVEAAMIGRREVDYARFGVAHALQTGTTQLLAPIKNQHLRAIAASEDDLALLRSLDLASALFVPLRARQRTIGVLTCITARARAYDRADVEFARVLSGRIALTLDNAGLHAEIGALEHRLAAVLDNVEEAVLVRDADGSIVYANPAAAEILRADSVEAVLRARGGELVARFEVTREDGTPVPLEELPFAAAARGRNPASQLVRNVDRQTGEERWLVSKATPVFDAADKLSLVVSVIEDVTEVKRAELAQRLLAEAGRVLSASLDYERTLQELAQLAVPALGDWCSVIIRGEGDVMESVAVAHSDPQRIAVARRLGESYQPRVSRESGVGAVIRSGQPRLVAEITPEVLQHADPEQAAVVRELGVHSVLIVPLMAPGRPPIGALSLMMSDSRRRFGADDLALAEELGRRAAIAVENARLYGERARVAETLQRSLLPPQLPEIAGFRLASLYRPAQTGGERNEVGGDFLDAFEIPGGWMIVVGDVAGRGPEAAALTSLSRWTLRTTARLLGDPVAALAQLNAELLERPTLSLVTVCCAVLRPGEETTEADIILAGHPPALHLRGGHCEAVGDFAPLLGFDAEPVWATRTIALEPGDHLVLYTDGVIERAGPDDRFGEERLAACLAGAAGAEDAVRRIERALERFAPGPQDDDTAVLAVERLLTPAAGTRPRAGTTRDQACR